VPLAAASGRREAGEEMSGVEGVKLAGADGRGGGGACLGAGLGLGLGLAGREEDEEGGEGPDPRTWAVPLKVEGEEEVTFFMKSFILSFIMAAGEATGRWRPVKWRRGGQCVGGERIWARGGDRGNSRGRKRMISGVERAS
jgi:hypothetical protein